MFKMTEADLAKKTDAQLAALFQEASCHLKPENANLPRVQSLLARLRMEIAKRQPSA